MKHVVTFSGGLGSWCAAKRVAAKHGTENLTLLFADTRQEDEDLYRFLREGAANVGGTLVKVAEGRKPWHIFFDERMLGNSRFDPCSKKLKREMIDRWVAENCDPASTTIHCGVDWSEEHRYTRLRDRMAQAGWRYEAPLCEPPYLSEDDMRILLAQEGIELPRLYKLGFAHNNCGGFCIKAGHGHYARLLKALPDRYAYHESMEQAFRTFIGREDVSILTDRRGDGKKKPLTLRDFRIRVEGGVEVDTHDVGGCGCFAEEPQPDLGEGAARE